MTAPDRDIRRLLDIMERLRDPQAGCPWDVEQTFATIAPYTIEEAYDWFQNLKLTEFEQEVAYRLRGVDLLRAAGFPDEAAFEKAHPEETYELNVGFTFGCLAISSGAGSFACAMAGAALGISLEYVIAEFGPEIVTRTSYPTGPE